MLRLDLYDHGALMTVYGDQIERADDSRGNGSVTTFMVDPRKVAEVMGAMPVSTGYLPRNTLFVSHTPQGAKIGTYFPPRRYGYPMQLLNVRSGKSDVVRVRLPGAVFISTQNGYRVFAALGYPDENTRLYQFPAPNVSLDGKICTGLNRRDLFGAGGAEDVRKAWKAFVEDTSFNDHLVGRKSMAYPTDVRGMWLELDRTGARWPVDDLVATGHLLKDVM